MAAATAHPVVLYGRVSQERNGDKSKSVDDQLTDLRAWAQREGWPVVAEHRDDGISASRYANGKARPGWQQTMDVIDSGQVRALLVWDFSRATRDDKVVAALKAACVQHGVKIGYGGMLRDPATADGMFYVGLDGLMAAKLSADISEKVQRASGSRSAAGRPHGALPFGYRRVISAQTGKTVCWEIDPEQAEVIREIADRLLDKQPADAIAADLNRRKITTATGAKWRGGNLSKLVLRPAYAGLRVHQGEVLDGVTSAWESILDLDTWHRLVALFGDPERDKYRNPTHVRHLGSGLYRCGRIIEEGEEAGEQCSGRMRVVADRDGGRHRYDCRTCHRVSRLQAPVDDYVERVLVARLSRPDALEAIAGGDPEVRAAARAEVARLDAEMAKARKLLETGGIDLADFAAFKTGWAPRKAAAERAARPPSLPGAAEKMVGPEAQAAWGAATISTKRAVLDALMIVTILPTGRYRGGRTAGGFDPETVKIEWKGAEGA